MAYSYGYEYRAYTIFNALPIDVQLKLEAVRQIGLIKLLQQNKAHIFDNSSFPILYKNKIPGLGMTVTYFFTPPNNDAVITDIQIP